jgi:hypothetical protein
VSDRVVTLLARNSEEAEKIRKFMVKAYSVRSKIVHGDKRKPLVIKGKTIDLDTFAQRLEVYLRKMVKSSLAFSTKYKKQDDIIILLDKSLFVSMTRCLTSFSQKIVEREVLWFVWFCCQVTVK